MRDGIGSASDLGVEGAGRGNAANGFGKQPRRASYETKRDETPPEPDRKTGQTSHAVPIHDRPLLCRFPFTLDEAIKLRSRAHLNADRRLTGDPFLFKPSELTSRVPTSLNLEQRTLRVFRVSQKRELVMLSLRTCFLSGCDGQ